VSRLTQRLLSISVGAVFGGFGGLLVLIFWPLLFPLSLQNSTWGEDSAPIAFLAFFICFSVTGFLFVQRLTRTYVRKDCPSTGRITPFG
jgi:TRAP-type C4-dicarboxylate transport system permease small subunit